MITIRIDGIRFVRYIPDATTEHIELARERFLEPLDETQTLSVIVGGDFVAGDDTDQTWLRWSLQPLKKIIVDDRPVRLTCTNPVVPRLPLMIHNFVRMQQLRMARTNGCELRRVARSIRSQRRRFAGNEHEMRVWYRSSNRLVNIVVHHPTKKMRMVCVRCKFELTPTIRFPRHLPQEVIIRVRCRKEDRRFQCKPIVRSMLDETLRKRRSWLHVPASN